MVYSSSDFNIQSNRLPYQHYNSIQSQAARFVTISGMVSVLQSFTIRFGLDYDWQLSHSLLFMRQFYQTAHDKHLTKINIKILSYCITSLLNFLEFLEHKLASEQEQVLRLIAVCIQYNMIKTNNIKRILILQCTLLSTTLIFQTSVTS